MSHRRVVLVFGVLVAGTALLTGTSGFSSVTADRGVHVGVAEDQNAYFGFEQTPTNTDNGTTDLDVTVTNQFPSQIDLTVVTLTTNGTTVDLVTDDPLESGEAVTRTFTSVSCGDAITIEASGNDVSAHLDRSVVCN